MVCGGAGYIGSHMVKMLWQKGYDVVTFDNFSTGNRWAVKWGEMFEGDLLDAEALNKMFRSFKFAAVMHFSARSLVAESVQNPALYYRNNVIGTLNLLEAMREAGVMNFIFSSSAATFGLPETEKIAESHPQLPINPYGQTKLMIEKMLHDYSKAYGLNSVSLRYFNAAGADPETEIGEAHEPETHLIPNILKAAAGGFAFPLYGIDYPTMDGTCVRDYIHIEDLCRAHLCALNYLDSHEGAFGFNLGNGKGFSVMEIVSAAEAVTGRQIDYNVLERREGDPHTLVANNILALQELEWQPEYTDISMIIETAWKWQLKRSA